MSAPTRWGSLSNNKHGGYMIRILILLFRIIERIMRLIELFKDN